MLENLSRISLPDNEKRRQALKNILHENKLDYFCQTGIGNSLDAKNIIIRFGKSSRRLVVGAHYDTYKGSTGANDNASGVCILIELAKAAKELSPTPNIDFVFFDCEETGGKGSKLYIQEIDPKNIPAMINFDICGVGDSVLTAPAKWASKGIFSKALISVAENDIDFEVISMLPEGDDRIFEKANIPNLSVGLVDAGDVSVMRTLFDKDTKVDKSEFPSIIETMHNGPRDSIASVQLSAMKQMLDFAKSLVFCSDLALSDSNRQFSK